MSFEVWAPSARSVDLVIGESRHPLARDPRRDGWWRPDASVTQLETHGPVDYGYEIDGEGPFPDPRSRRQPAGVHELSQTFDPTSFAWSDGAWTGRPLAGSVLYELHIGTFTPEGTLDAAIGRLDHLRELGVDFVEVLPVNAFNGTHNWGYDGVLWYAVHEPYGGPEAYQRFVDACHAAGIGVIQDVVYNHLGPSGNYLPKFGPYLRDDKANTWGSALNLDGPESDEVRRYILDNALMWLNDYHADGLRLDAVHALVDTRATPILEELAAEVSRLSAHLRRPLTLIAESDLNDPKLITSREAHGDGLDAQWSDDFHHALHVALTGETTGYYEDFAGLGTLAKVLRRGYFHDGTMSTFRGRHHGRSIDTLTMPTSRLVVFSQDHDQVGNRAAGDRLSSGLDDGGLAIAAALTLLGPFTPMLFMGEEWAASTPWQFFTSHPEPELAEATASGRKAEFARMGWDESQVPDPQDPETFLRSKLDWNEVESGRHARLLAFYRELIRLRRERADLTDPSFATVGVDVDENDGWLVLRRASTALAINFGADPVTVPGVDDTAVVSSFGEHSSTEGGIRLGGHSLVVVGTGAAERGDTDAAGRGDATAAAGSAHTNADTNRERNATEESMGQAGNGTGSEVRG
ncbi:malto-oligosyltrehalose trehalohydrolase [Humibacter sp.]|jgi:maltooligosyltrehalose trehalohydrolase|uniref:malto-oligosyltrehalose trehalohydrolase n=1 Tax=Humibacter sp. TaxID=1940291 RepID=UPI002B5AE69B|nr:malto-oligosyltrehalose trehalohydrolase [Humibacter sp.]HVX07331.1 malto-oligosyltrehalose trehalohydrolase [Humibacter sp.]